MRLLAFVLMCQVVLGLCACAPKGPTLHKLAPLPEGKICRVAVLPFANETDNSTADLIVYRVLVAELVKSGLFMVSQEGDVREILRQMRIRSSERADIEQLKVLASRLGVQGVVTGTVVEMVEVPEMASTNPHVAVSFQVVDAMTGRTLWETYHRREGAQYRKVMHFGVVNTATSLAQRVCEEVLELWIKEGLEGCAD